MPSVVVFLGDGMADEPLEELNGKTPIEAVHTPAMDKITASGLSGTLLTLPKAFPTSSDVANMSVLGYDLKKYYFGRGPLEAAAQGISLASDEIAFRCNIVNIQNEILIDYSSGHIDNKLSKIIINDLKKEFDSEKIKFHTGVSYRNLLVLKGDEFSPEIVYKKPDSSQGLAIAKLLPKAIDSNNKKAVYTAQFISELMYKTYDFLKDHHLTKELKNPPNMVWPWSPGKKTDMPSFENLYGYKAGVITAVDVIAGLAKSTNMDIIPVEGATGFIDTNYENKAQAAIKAIKEDDYKFLYLHVEAVDECSHMGDLKLKMQAIKDFDSRIVGPVMEGLKGQDVTFAVLPDHPVPVKLRKHTRTPVPFSVCGKHINKDNINSYSEIQALNGAAGQLQGNEFMKLILGKK